MDERLLGSLRPSTYHQLGVVAQEQRQWEQAEKYYLLALPAFVAYQDSYSTTIVLRSLARLWQASASPSLPGAVASVLGVTPDKAEDLLRRILADK